MDCYKEKIKKCFFATHEAESEEKPIFNNLQEIKIWDVPNIIDNLFTDEKQKWIINVDIDYFFCEDKLAGDSQLLMLSDDYIANIFEPLANQIKKDTISVFTLCLSPELSSGWDNSYEICAKICEILELDFSLDLKN